MARIEKSLLIIGAGSAGRLLYSDIKDNYRSHHVIGFLDDRPARGRLPILGGINDCGAVIGRYAVDEIILAIPSAPGELVRRILLNNLNHRLPLRIVPRSQRVIGRSDVRYEEIKDIGAEDFLGRAFIRQEVDRLKRFYRSKTVFVTGGAGSIGSEIVEQLLDLDVKKVIVYDNSEYLTFLLEQRLKETNSLGRCELIIGNIVNSDKLEMLFRTRQPDIIFHAAAYKHVHLMQDNIDEAVHNNVIGTKAVVDAAVSNRIKRFTMISTDKVVNPTSVMGATKKLGEYYIRSVKAPKTNFHIVRFGNVINSRGSVLPLFEQQIELRNYVTVTHQKMMRFFMSIREAALLVIESSAGDDFDSTHVLNMGELINIYEVAQCLIRSKNLLPGQDIEIRIAGLRKGEKLVEELYTEEEGRSLNGRRGKRIMALRSDSPPADINEIIDKLSTQIKAHDDKALRRTLKALFPSLKLR